MGKIADAIVAEGLRVTIAEIGREYAVGDVVSDDKGSGARMSAGKLPVELIPVRTWARIFMRHASSIYGDERSGLSLITCVEDLAAFQEGRADGDYLLSSVPPQWFDDAALVFEYGATHGYTPWNWLKGMLWSVPLACAIRHAKALLIDKEPMDAESGLHHIGHFVANLIMLSVFYDTYPEGNDFPASKFFEVSNDH